MNGMNEINKPITMAIKETKAKMINVVNESGLSPTILDLILQGIYSEVHSFAERQAAEEEKAYMQTIKDNDINNNKMRDVNTLEQKENGNE